MTIKIF